MIVVGERRGTSCGVAVFGPGRSPSSNKNSNAKTDFCTVPYLGNSQNKLYISQTKKSFHRIIFFQLEPISGIS
jgi:hypothetical protein